MALTWLALQATGDSLALGSVLAVAGLPPALLMLVSGVLVDRFTPRAALLLAESLRLAVVCALVALILAGNARLPALYAAALAFGLLTALAMPAAGSIVPSLVPRPLLQPANSFFLGLAQFAAFIGPAVGGLIIGAGRASDPHTSSIALAFAVYGAGLAVSVLTLRMMALNAPTPAHSPSDAGQAVAGLVAGWRYAWHDPLLRVLLAAILGANFLLTGPLAVGVPILARNRLPEGAAVFGLIAAGWGGGNLLGALLAGISRQSKGLGALLCTLFLAFGGALAALGWANATWLGFLILFVVGVGNGYLGVILRTLLHRRTPAALLGRVMSVFFFARTLLVPVSQTVSGAMIKVSLQALFAGAGILFVFLALGLVCSSAPRLFEQEVERAQHEVAPSS